MLIGCYSCDVGLLFIVYRFHVKLFCKVYALMISDDLCMETIENVVFAIAFSLVLAIVAHLQDRSITCLWAWTYYILPSR